MKTMNFKGSIVYSDSEKSQEGKQKSLVFVGLLMGVGWKIFGVTKIKSKVSMKIFKQLSWI